jgi:hypothetical protein
LAKNHWPSQGKAGTSFEETEFGRGAGEGEGEPISAEAGAGGAESRCRRSLIMPSAAKNTSSAGRRLRGGEEEEEEDIERNSGSSRRRNAPSKHRPLGACASSSRSRVLEKAKLRVLKSLADAGLYVSYSSFYPAIGRPGYF